MRYLMCAIVAAVLTGGVLWLLDVEPCGVITCHCGCREKEPCRCAADE